MRSFLLGTGWFFAIVASAHLLRMILRWPVSIASVAVPMWPSAVAVCIAGVLSVSAFRLANSLRHAHLH
jgi:hypothetical protein